METKSKIVIIDDAPENLHILLEVLGEGYSVVPFKSGKKALESMENGALPDLILLDVMMPDMDGFETCRRLKERSDTSNIPIIFITALNDPISEARALSMGGVDFISKPINPIAVKARVKTHLSLCRAYRDLAASLEKLSWEREIIEEILLTMRQHPLLRAPYLRTLFTPVERTSGDIVLLEQRPDGYLHVLLGDCTGHGIPAAILGPMVMDIFFAMTRKGLPPQEILDEINRKLYERVPPNVFMAAYFLEVSPAQERVRLWNYAMPEACLLRRGQWLFPSHSTATFLGVQPHVVNVGSQATPLLPSDRLYVFSDGIVETQSPHGEVFDSERLRKTLGEIVREGETLEALLPVLNRYREKGASDDDITLLELRTPGN
ncbi:PP2C family protein-serine/threonine phosphatase [Magnetococcus marinus]|nr:fused response regulator/phosphatase [Magnetococcus marinus]